MNIEYKCSILAATGCLLLAQGVADADEGLEETAIYFEQNVTDRDAEVVLKATAGDEGLAALKVVAPDGRTLIDFAARDARLGIRSFSFESPEPEDIGSVQADYPEGEYSFVGTTRDGATLQGKAVLNHRLPDAVALVSPKAGADDVQTTGMRIAWTPVADAMAYIVVIEQEEANLEIEARLSASATGFAVPDGFLIPDTEYKVAVGSVSRNGNESFVESEFTTAAQE